MRRRPVVSGVGDEPDHRIEAQHTGRRRSRGWTIAAVVVLLGGVICSILIAFNVAANDATKRDNDLDASSVEVAASVDLVLRHQIDLVVNASGYVTSNPNTTDTGFNDWADSVHVLERYPELISISRTELAPPGSSAICETTARQTSHYNIDPRNNDDVCAGPDAAVWMDSRDTGSTRYLADTTRDGVAVLRIISPLYADGAEPTTMAVRQDEFLGWVDIIVRPQTIINEALAGHDDTSVSVRYRDAVSAVEFHRGDITETDETRMIEIDRGWTVTTYADGSSDGIWGNGAASAIALGGSAAALLLAVLILTLSTGRAHAWRVADTQTNELRHQALHDQLTDLPNRALIGDRVQQLLARNRRNRTEGAALYIDLDDFKEVNDTLGHGVGDHLLQAVAKRMSETLRGADTIGRMGGDEFVVLVDGGDDDNTPQIVAQRLIDAMHERFDLPDTPHPIVITASIGIAVGERDSPNDLLRDADIALYQAKNAGRDRYATFSTDMEKALHERRSLEAELREALTGHQFQLEYQPVYGLIDLTPIGAEALLRWRHPTLGLMQPHEFIPVLESNGMIIEVGTWVLREACRQTAQWRAAGNDLSIAVNVSARQFDRDSIVDDVREILRISGLDPSQLTLEVTETALMTNVEHTARRLRALKALGIMIAIDDFGTGYCSFMYLQRFPVDCLKIDQSFTALIGQSRESDMLAHTLIQLGQNLGLRTLAEGIETETQLDFLRAEGVDEAQGFLLSRSLSPNKFEQLLMLRSGVPDSAPSSALHNVDRASGGEST